MLPKKNRVDKKTIEKIFKEGSFINSPNLTLKFIYSENKVPRISFITPKSVAKKANLRNLLRRRGYSALKKQILTFPANFAGVFIFGKKSAENFGGKKNKKYKPAVNLEGEIAKIFKKIN